MLTALLNALFGCSHKQTTFPITPVRKSSNSGSTYVVCLDCGAEFEYDWGEMRIGEARKVVTVPVSTQRDPAPLATNLQPL